MEEKTTTAPEFITEQKTRIARMIANKKDDIALLKEINKAEDTPNRQKIENSQSITKAETEIKNLEKALGKIETHSNYGICVDCGSDISAGRLKSSPTADRCTRCTINHERKN